VQVPAISRFEWHPFTISACIGPRLQVHIKADGDWTSKLHELAVKAQSQRASGEQDFVDIKVGIDGPFGAPAQRFWSYDKAIIIGAGMYVSCCLSSSRFTSTDALHSTSGVTPFAAILTDLEENYKAKGDPWQLTRASCFKLRKRTVRHPVAQPAPMHLIARTSTIGSSSTLDDAATLIKAQALQRDGRPGRKPSSTASTLNDAIEVAGPKAAAMPASHSGSRGIPRVDFRWVVREKTDLLYGHIRSIASTVSLLNSLSPTDGFPIC
jgi:respiratory burst oxidase